MASLTGEQLKDSYQSLVTIGNSIVPNPTSGQLENGLGNPITALGIGTASPNSDHKVHIEAGSGNNTSLLVTTTDNADTAQVIIGHDEGLQGGLQLVSDKTNSIAKIRVTNSSFHPLAFEVRGSDGINERMRITPGGNVGIGATSVNAVGSKKTLHIDDSSGSAIRLSESSTNLAYLSYDSTDFFRLSSSDQISFLTSGSEHMRIDSSGNVGIGTDNPSEKVQIKMSNTGELSFLEAGSSSTAIKSSGSLVFEANPNSNFIFQGFDIGSGTTERMRIDSSGNILPGADDSQDLGSVTKRFDDVYATNGTIQTSDRNEKQDIEELNDAELRVAQKAKTLLRKFRWKSSVESKGDEARIHFGIIAQDLEQAFTDEGLDAGRYGMFIKSTWTNEDGEEQTRLGVRYNQLLAFIISAL